MDCRISLILGLAVGVLGGSAGCTPSVFSRKATTEPAQQVSQKEPASSPAPEKVPEKVVKKGIEKELPKRTPKAATCVAFGDFRLRESKNGTRTPEQQHSMRDQAKKAYQQALRIDPKCVEAHRGLAQVYAADNEVENAISTYQGAVRVAPKDAGLWFDLGIMHSRRQEWKLAIDALTNAAELNPDNRQYANVLGFCLARAGQYEQSLTYFTQVVGEAKAHFNVGRMMLHVGQVEQGKQQIELALRKEPKFAEARDLLAKLEQGKVPAKQAVVPVQYEEPIEP
jgi:tetratricopeptide (TPR) repeat protein